MLEIINWNKKNNMILKDCEGRIKDFRGSEQDRLSMWTELLTKRPFITIILLKKHEKNEEIKKIVEESMINSIDLVDSLDDKKRQADLLALCYLKNNDLSRRVLEYLSSLAKEDQKEICKIKKTKYKNKNKKKKKK
jgi:hypothetical protein